MFLRLTLLLLSTSVLVSSQRWARCPSFCPKTGVEPICASDGIIYPSECEMRRKTCGKGVSPVSDEFCTRAAGSKCTNKCVDEEDLSCGDDGRTYLNRCKLQVAGCRLGVHFAHYGPCLNTTLATIERCPTNCKTAKKSGPVCGSDGNTYSSECDMKVKTCGQGVVKTNLKHCQTTKNCKDHCWRYGKPVCASNGQIYNNDCLMRSKNCGKHVFEVPMAFCSAQERSAQSCPLSCVGEPYDPVCGSNGRIYDNICDFNMLNCGNKYTIVRVTSFSMCRVKFKRCESIVCPTDLQSQCGSDGTTYINQCELRKAACRKGIRLSHEGNCTDLLAPLNCPNECPDPKPDEILCGSDGNVYLSKCDMRMRTCGQHVVPVHESHCKATTFCKVSCNKQGGKTVCGSDGKIYRNECLMKAENCGRHIYPVPVMRCLSNFQFSGCLRICPSEYDPVCGSDEKTYTNSCFLKLENCRSRALVFIKHPGKCGQKPFITPKFYLW